MSRLRSLLTMWQSRIAALWPSVDPTPTPKGQRSNREHLIEELLAIEQRDREDVAAYQRRLNTLGKVLQDAEQHAARLREELSFEHGRQTMRSFEIDAQVTKIRNALAASCPVQVDAFIEKVNAEIDHCQRPQNVGPGVADRLTNLRRARQQAEALRTAPLAMAALMTELRRLEKSLPAVSQEHLHGLVAVH